MGAIGACDEDEVVSDVDRFEEMDSDCVPIPDVAVLVACDELGIVVDDFCVELGELTELLLVLLFEVEAVFCALILAFKLAVYWLVLCMCLGVEVRLREEEDELLFVTLALEPLLVGVVTFEYLLAALLALVVVYCRWIVSLGSSRLLEPLDADPSFGLWNWRITFEARRSRLLVVADEDDGLPEDVWLRFSRLPGVEGAARLAKRLLDEDDAEGLENCCCCLLLDVY